MFPSFFSYRKCFCRTLWANTCVLLVDNFKLTLHQFKGVAPSMQCQRSRLHQRSDGAPGMVCYARPALAWEKHVETHASALAMHWSERREFFFCIFQEARPEWHEDSAADLRSAPEAHVVQSGLSAPLPVRQRLCEMNTRGPTGASAGSRSEFVR